MSTLNNLEQKCYVYIKKFPFATDGVIHCKNKERDINGISDQRLKEQKFYAYKLLEYAMNEQFGIKSKEINLNKLSSGKWVSDFCNFSISHSGEVVCVALSNVNVGVDVERYNPERFIKIKDKMLTKSEKKLAPKDVSLGEYLNELWTKKEAVFKCIGGKVFIPSKIQTERCYVCSKKISLEKDYFLSIASSEKIELVLLEN